jgi:hypothetical protein
LEAIGDTEEFMRRLANRGAFHAKRNSRKFRKTGHTGRTIKRGRVTATSSEFHAEGAAVYLEHGTKAHTIRARRARALRFAATSSGRRLTGSPRRGAPVVFARSVRHPGTQAQPFMRPAAQKAADEAGVYIVEIWNGAA